MTIQKTIERRSLKVQELRAVDTQAMTIRGYAAVFNTLSEELWGFFEMIAPGAFTNALTRSDPFCLFNHEEDNVLGRLSSGTLRLNEDERGLAMECDLPDTQFARDLLVVIKRGDITQMSFAFTVLNDQWAYSGDKLIRTITEVDKIYDVSPVTYPAYAETEVSAEARSKVTAMKEEHAAHIAQAGAVSGATAGQVPTSVLRRRLDLHSHF